ncbi:MAG: ATP-binding protein, partial [Smithella sp.]
VMRILTRTGIAAYSFSGTFMLMLILNAVHISLKHGTAPVTPVVYAAYGYYLCAYLKKRELGYRFGKLATDLQAAMASKAYECRTNLIFEILVRHNKEHIRNTLAGFPENHLKGLNSGDLASAGHIMMQHFVYAYLSGRELHLVRKEMEDYRADLQITGDRTAISVCMMYLQGILNLLEGFEKPWQLKGQYFNEEELPHYQAANDQTVIFNSYFNKMILSYLFGHYEDALENLEIVREYFHGAIGTYCIPVYNFYGALIHLEMLSTAFRKKDKHVFRRKIAAYLREVKGYYKDAPENNENKYFLIKAVQAHVSGIDDRAMRYCDQSIQAAGKYGFLPEEALANELAARIACSAGREEISKGYAQAAVYCYSKWGCSVKAELLQTEYALNKDTKGVEFISPQPLDVESIVQASQAISEEIVIEELMKKMIRIVLQNAGARKVLFITEKDGELYIEAEGTAANKEIKIIEGSIVRGNSAVLEKLVNYVMNTGESIVLNSEAEIERFTGERPGNLQRARSLFCMPVESKRSLVGLLYLENDLIDGAFTGQHLLVLKVLASQLAISLENARLYQSMERMVDERTEELRIKNDELECANNELINANRAKNEFMANMSHEMRTPLHGVIGLAGMLQKGFLEPEQEETVNAIIFSARSLLEIINRILDFSKLGANRVDLEERDFELHQLIRELLPTFRQMAEEKGLTLACRVQPETPQNLRGDSQRIKQIMANLLSNAVKFTERGGIEIEAAVADSGDVNAVMEISVKDSGIGIPNDKISHIFEEFYQADSSTTRKFGGTGLGLPITKKLVEKMNGAIGVESIPGRGSTFTCSIRLGLSEGGVDSLTSGIRSEKDLYRREPLGLKILVAEDNVISIKYIKSLLEYQGCQFTLAANGMEVLEKIKSDVFDCILMDKNMPELDGIAATRIIRKNEAGTGRHIPIIALTASAIVGDREKLLAAGMDYYLSKPLREPELLHILKAVKGESATELSGAEPGGAVEYELIDSKVFMEEAELYGEEVMLEIILKFLTDYEDVLMRIEEAVNKADFTCVEKEVHKLAGTVSIFYCSRLVNLLKRVEQTAAGKDQDSLAGAYPGLRDGVIRLTHELEEVRERLQNNKGW